MASETDDKEEAEEEFVTLRCIDLDLSCGHDDRDDIVISTLDIHLWDLTSILAHPLVKIEVKRNRLIENSSYFRGLLSGSFSDSFRDLITVHWNLESFLSTLRCMFGCPVDVTLDKFVNLYEAGLFFGVEMLLLKCQDWFREISSSRGLCQPQLELSPLINIWQYGLEHANDFIQQLCASCLAENFMWAMSCDSFTDIPHPLFSSVIQHHDLTVDSEKHLCQGILIWLAAMDQHTRHIRASEDYCHGLLKQVRFYLLPLWFVTSKQRCCLFPQFAEEGLDSIIGLFNNPSAALTRIWGAEGCSQLRLRLTEYTKIVDLSGHPNIWPFLFLSMLSSLQAEDIVLRKNAMFSPDKFQRVTGYKSLSSWHLSQTLSFEAVDEVDISNCPLLDLEDALECFNKSFPSLRKLRAAHFIGFNAKRFHHLVKKCPLLCDIDLSVDISPVIPSKVSITSSQSEYAPQTSSMLSDSGHNTCHALLFSMKNRHSVHITRLSLEGRTDISDSGLRDIAFLCASLCYLNLNGCISVTDAGIAFVIIKCCKLHSISACDTSFGDNSVHALCWGSTELDFVTEAECEEASQPLAVKLETLHIGGCKGVSETSLSVVISQSFMLKHLCLRETKLGESGLSNFRGSSLETLDISETKVSLPCLVGLVDQNPHLKRLIARGCRNLSHTSRNLFSEIANYCKLEEIEIGWGFSPYSAKALQPAMKSLRRIVIGLGGSLGEEGLQLIPCCCPLLETLVLYYQEISDALILNVIQNSKHLQVLVIRYGFGEVSSLSLNFSSPSLKKLKLERVTTWMTNADLVTLTNSCPNLTELSLVGCGRLNAESQDIIAGGWPGLISLKLEECGEDLTRNGVSSLLNCRALEDLVLRHTGSGLAKNIIALAASQLPMLRKLSLDMCDAKDGGFDVPRFLERFFLSSVKIARCKLTSRFLELHDLDVRKTPVHKETLVLVWNSVKLSRAIVKERL